MLEKTVEKTSAATPCYVLMDEKNKIGPPVSDGTPGKNCLAIYGFSGKIPYDRFEQQSEKKLTPYPLVKGYLSNQIAVDDSAGILDSSLKLVVLDAAGPDAPLLHAATMKAVLEAQENRMPHVTISHHLSFDVKTSTYQITSVV